MRLFLFSTFLLLYLPAAAFADLDLPVAKGIITSGVGWRIDPFGSGKLFFHRGIDIAVPVGTPVRSVRSGRVVFAGEPRGYGATVIVEHLNGDRTLYGHNTAVQVAPGDLVESGAIIALSGNTGRSTGPHVHFEQILSGRPSIDQPEPDQAGSPQLAGNSSEQRYILELQMDEAVDSIIRTINRTGPAAGQGG